jgi:DNA repair exonuclease SbcCD ATPase subunit
MSKITAFFLAFLVCFSFATESTSKKDLISLLSAKTEYVVDDVLDLLKGLLDTAQSELDTLQADWPGIQAEKQGAVDLYTGLVNDQSDECDTLSAQNIQLAEDIADTQEEIATDSAQIVTNNDRVNILLDARCTQNRNYITGLKHNKQTLAIIQILRDAIESFNPSLLEKKHLKVVAARFINFLQFAKKEHITGLAQILQDLPDVEERTSDEIGTGHIDNTQDEITVADFDSQTIESLQGIKTKLINLLNDLETGLQTEIQQNEANEATANEELADFEMNIENENNYLNTQITTLNDELTTLQAEKQQSDEDVEACEATLEDFQNSLDTAKSDFEAATENYDSNNARLQDELALFQEVYNLYETEVASASEALKQEVDIEEEEAGSGDEIDILYAPNPEGEAVAVADIQKRSSIKKRHH